jgi:hypothetical protein
MAGLNEDGQWIILLGLIISVSIFFLALIANEAVLVGQTTAESVLDLPKADIQNIRSLVVRTNSIGDLTDIIQDIEMLSLYQKTALVTIQKTDDPGPPEGYTITITYNNGVIDYEEILYYY